MKRWLGSVATAVALLSIAVAAAAVNVRILDSNRTDTSPIVVQTAAEVLRTVPAPIPSDTTVPEAPVAAGTVQADPNTVAAPAAASTPQPLSGNRIVGSVNRADDDDDDDDHEDDDDHDDMWKRKGAPHGDDGHGRRFVPLTPSQAALLRIAALAQVSPLEARDAANGIGSTDVIARVKQASERIGVPLAVIAAVNDLPPERGRRHGANDDHQDEGDDDD